MYINLKMKMNDEEPVETIPMSVQIPLSSLTIRPPPESPGQDVSLLGKLCNYYPLCDNLDII